MYAVIYFNENLNRLIIMKFACINFRINLFFLLKQQDLLRYFCLHFVVILSLLFVIFILDLLWNEFFVMFYWSVYVKCKNFYYYPNAQHSNEIPKGPKREKKRRWKNLLVCKTNFFLIPQHIFEIPVISYAFFLFNFWCVIVLMETNARKKFRKTFKILF